MKLLTRAVAAAFTLALVSLPALAQNAEPRTIVTTENSDYFGFDLRSQQNLTLDQCKTTCLDDNACRAFTYNVKAKWCFLKSDFATMKPFNGAVAGKVVSFDRQPDIGAPARLGFVPDWMVDEARQYRDTVLQGDESTEDMGVAGLTEAAGEALRTGDPRTAVTRYSAAIVLMPDDGELWLGLARAFMAAEPASGDETAEFQRNASSAAYNAYLLQRTADTRAEALSVLARTLDRREMFRPALQAYEASLGFANDAGIRAAYDDLKARKGFRVVDHSIDADVAAPRVCAQFSEELVKSGVDYAPFVTLDGATPKAVEADDKQICVEGLQHGQHYRVTFRAGLPAAIGEVLAAPVTLSVYVQDRARSIRFTGDSFVLPAHARRGIPLVSVNTEAADLKLYRIGDRSLAQLLSGYQFLSQLDTYDLDTVSNQMGEPVWQGQLAIDTELNKEVTTSFPVDEALPERKPGVYVLTAKPTDDRSNDDTLATQWFVVSDIGLNTYTGDDGLNIFARSLGSAKPLAGVELTLLARNNEILGKATTDADGRATLNPGLVRGEGGMEPAVLMASGENDDFVFLDMTLAGFDLSDRGVTGRAAPGALDVFAWTERGIYRAGETVHAAALARDGAADAVEGLPLTFIFTRPDGVEDRRIVTDGKAAGGHATELPLSSAAMRGTWSFSVYTDPKQPAIATQNFLVEDFVPDRIEFDMTADRKEMAAGDTANVEIDGRFLYGAPAAGLALEGEVALATSRQWDSFKGYLFGLADEEQGEATRLSLDDLPVLDEQGKATIPVTVDDLPSTTRLVTAKVTARLREGGGRAVERSLEIAIRPATDVIGIRPDFAGDEVPQGGTAKFSLIAADPTGARTALPDAQWSLVKVERNYQWYRSGNSWNYEPVTTTRAVASGKVDIATNSEASITMPVDWGRYRLQVETADPSGPVSSYEFDAGWYVSATSTETPDGLEIALDKDSYAPGETAKLKVSPRFAGELLIAIGADTLLKTVTATVPEGGATVDIPVGDDWGAGAYVTATLFRPGDGRESRMPGRAIGVKWLKVDPGARKLDVTLTPPEKIEPRQALSVPVSVAGAKAGEKAYVMVAAVDVGILNLTRYQAPDPEGWFFGQRMLGLELRDIYGRLIDGSLGATGRLRTGGDGGGMTAQGNPPTEKLVAFFSGIVELDDQGKAIVSFDIPQFNGTARVMAVAWTRTAVGHAQADVIIRDPVVITAGLPRFMAPGDTATMRLDIANTDAPDGEYQLAIDTGGDLTVSDTAPTSVHLAGGKRQVLTVPLTANEAGPGSIVIRLTNAEGLNVEQALSLPVRPGELPITTRLMVALNGNGGSVRVDDGLLSASVLGDASISVGVSQASAFDVPSLLMSLDRYPYGCAEQTTSRALPLLYVNELSEGENMASDPALRERVQNAVYKLMNYQSSSGSFGLWGPGSGDLWLDSYVTDFLTRAREMKYDVPEAAMRQALDNLQNSLSYDTDVESRGSEIAYALYVLARNKKASVGDLRYYADTQLEAFTSPMAVGQLAASLALYGDAQRSQAAFTTALQMLKSNKENNWFRSDYGSRLRDGSAVLALAGESQPVPSVVPELIKLVSAERNKVRWTSTQDEAWMLLAARALKAGNDALSLTVDGAPHKGAFSRRVTGPELIAAPIVVENNGPEKLQAVITAVASPSHPVPAGGDGFAIDRTYYTMDGEETNVSEAEQNQRFVVVLRVQQLNKWRSRLLVTDMLPAGFEIDNPSLVSSAELGNFDWLEQTEAAHLEFRDDRFVAAMDQEEDAASEFTLAYVVRAVTPGIYTHPAAQVEDMYRPQLSARTATGMMEVRGQ